MWGLLWCGFVVWLCVVVIIIIVVMVIGLCGGDLYFLVLWCEF